MTPAEYLDAAKARLNIKSDYEIAKRLDVHNGNVADMRKGKRAVPLDVAFKLAITLELDPAEVVADLESQREKNPDRQGFWRSFISHARTATVALMCMLALSFSGISGDGPRAGAGFFRRPMSA